MEKIDLERLKRQVMSAQEAEAAARWIEDAREVFTDQLANMSKQHDWDDTAMADDIRQLLAALDGKE